MGQPDRILSFSVNCQAGIHGCLKKIKLFQKDQAVSKRLNCFKKTKQGERRI